MTDEQKASSSAEDAYFETVRKAFLRGAEWHRQYGDDPLISKAAYDHADAATSAALLPADTTPEPAADTGAAIVSPYDPPPHWTPGDGWTRHPQAADEWDWRLDSPENDPRERSRKRLCFAADRADLRAPDQMALVLRTDLSRVTGELAWRRAQVEVFNPETTNARVNEISIRAETAEAERDRLRAEIAAKDAALKPFAAVADLIDIKTVGFADTDKFRLMSEVLVLERFKLSDFRAARAAIKMEG